MDHYQIKARRGLFISFIMGCLAAVFMMCSGCYTEKKAVAKFGCKLTDSSHTDTIIKDRFIPVYLPGDSVTITVQSPCDSTGKLKPINKDIKGKNGRLTGKLYTDTTTNSLIAKCFEEEYKDSLLAQDSIISIYRRQIIKEAYIKPLTKFEKFKQDAMMVFAFLGLASLLILIVFIIIKAIK